jgi:hypothetical protein
MHSVSVLHPRESSFQNGNLTSLFIRAFVRGQEEGDLEVEAFSGISFSADISHNGGGAKQFTPCPAWA